MQTNNMATQSIIKTVENIRKEGLDKFYTLPSYSKKMH
jgi:hypothetical protein